MKTFEAGTGFSIELDMNVNDWRLELRGTYKGLPLYESLGGEVTAIALVEDPAIERKIHMRESDRTITGPVMIPDQKIFRDIGPKGPEDCYWYFSSGTIRRLQEEFKGGLKFGH